MLTPSRAACEDIPNVSVRICGMLNITRVFALAGLGRAMLW
jgi:hypothetical protein